MVKTPLSTCLTYLTGYVLGRSPAQSMHFFVGLFAIILISLHRYPTNALSFSHDGEFIAIASQGPYIDIVSHAPILAANTTSQAFFYQCATETGAPMHRIPALGPAQTVSWHPSKYVIAYCGQTERREGGPPVAAWISLFGPGM